MARAGVALAVLVALPLLAGCAGPVGPGTASPDTETPARAGLAVPPSHLEAGTFYVFHHAGGTLGLGVLPGGSAQIELFDGADRRLGQFSVSDALAGGSVQLQGLDSGDYVIRTLAVNGTLRIGSGGAAPALRPLAGHIERQVLLQRPRGDLPAVPSGVPGLPGSPPVALPLDLHLVRAPTSLRVLVSGDYTHLALDLRSPLGPVVAANSSGFFARNLMGFGLAEVGSEFHAENVRDGHLVGRIEAQDLQGAVVLEASSYSRAEPLAAPAAPARGPPRFSYGALPDGPVRFQSGPRATQLLLRGTPFEGGNRTWVALFSDRGHRIGTWPVATGAALAVPVAPSTAYIAVRLRGNATLGADAPPADFDLHPLAVRQQTVPAQGAGSAGDYGQGQTEVDGAGVFAIVPTWANPRGDSLSGFNPQVASQPCGTGTQVRILQGNETLGFWGDRAPFPPPSDAELRLRDGPLRVLDDGFGETACPHLAARIQSFGL